MRLPKFTIRGFRPPREAVISSLGTLERRTLEEVWEKGTASVHDVVRGLGGQVAYTTIMTTLDRLYKKGYLDRQKQKRAYLYKPRMSREELQIGLTEDFITGLIDGATKNVEPVLACIVDAVSDHDKELLDDLERLIKAKRSALEHK